MPKHTLNVESLAVETFATAPEQEQAANLFEIISRKSCIEQCTGSCVP
ncbi:MAG TPA: hypothetical protein VFJ82_16820 [Longimicrobium sp.]|nr:hypothetical protein [Longimicrobium sp.]